MYEKKENTHSAGSKPAHGDKHGHFLVRVRSPEMEKINETVALLESEFYRRAKALSIPIIKRRKGRNVPGIPEAMECLLCEEWGDCSLENRVYWYVQTRLITKYCDPMWLKAEEIAKGVQ